MKKFILLFISTLFTLSGVSQGTKTTQHFEKVDGKLAVKYQGKYFKIDTTTITVKIEDISKISKDYKIIRKNKLGFVDLLVPPAESIDEHAKSLSKNEMIENVIYSRFGEYTSFYPNDYTSSQWNLMAMRMFEAWDITTGDSNVIVAIIDSGIDWTHSDLGLGADLYQNIYLNPGEDAWSDPNDPSTGNGVDDDNNGLIDDWKGWNYGTNTNDSRPTFEHGTFVAGILGAKTNNNHGIAGIAGGNNNSGVKLLSYCISIHDEVISSVLDDAIIDAVDKGARIIQLSLSVDHSADIEAAIQYAIDNNVVVVCATGNSNLSQVFFPASDTNVISVGAIDDSKQKWTFSNYGENLDIMAPGYNVPTTSSNGSYAEVGGTSMAAPHVSGVIALMLSINPNLTVSQIRNIIESTAQKVRTDLYDYEIKTGRPNGTWNDSMGYGLIDAYAAVLQVACRIKFTNQIVATDTAIIGCEINVQNVTVQNNAKLTLAAKYLTTINGPFEVTLGSQLNIPMVIVENGESIIIGLNDLGLNTGGTPGSDPEGTWMLQKKEREFIWDPEVWNDYFENNIPVNEWFTLTINGNQLSGKSGCSGFRGNLASTGNFVFTGVQSNLVGCFPQIQNLEHLYVDFIRRATYMYVSGDTMYLFIGTNPVLEFYRQPE